MVGHVWNDASVTLDCAKSTNSLKPIALGIAEQGCNTIIPHYSVKANRKVFGAYFGNLRQDEWMGGESCAIVMVYPEDRPIL